jgi:hypothetical protein
LITAQASIAEVHQQLYHLEYHQVKLPLKHLGCCISKKKTMRVATDQATKNEQNQTSRLSSQIFKEPRCQQKNISSFWKTLQLRFAHTHHHILIYVVIVYKKSRIPIMKAKYMKGGYLIIKTSNLKQA